MGLREPLLRPTEDQFLEWIGSTLEGVLQASEEIRCLIAVDELDDEHPMGTSLLAGFTWDEPMAEVDRAVNELLLSGPRSFIGMGTRINWTHEPEPAPTMPAWAFVCVARRRPPELFCRRDIDETWARVSDWSEWPLFARSTAQGLRATLLERQPFRMREGVPGERTLLDTPEQVFKRTAGQN